MKNTDDPIFDINTKEYIHVANDNINEASSILRALNHKARRRILKFVQEERKPTVTDIYIKLKMDQCKTSQHLAILRKAGIIRRQREGKFMYYTIDFERVFAIDKFVKGITDDSRY